MGLDGIGIFTDPSRVDLYGFHAGRYTREMKKSLMTFHEILVV